MKDTTPVILGIDPATSTGACLIDFNKNLVWFDTYKLKSNSKSVTGRLSDILGRGLCHQYNIQAIAVEEAFGFAKAAAIRNRLTGVVECLAEQMGIPVIFCHVAHIKQFATGKGNAKKQEMIAAVKEKYPAFDGDDNAADAVMIALYALEQLRS